MIAPLTHRVGKFRFSIAKADRPPDQAQRTQALANWLLSEWRKQQEARRDDTARRN